MNELFKKAVMSVVVLTTSILLVGCGHQSASSQQKYQASSTSTVENKPTKAYYYANHLIKRGNYQRAYNVLNNINHHSKQVSNLSTDLQSYLNAKNSYKNGNYDEAINNLKKLKSNSSAMQNAYINLQAKISDAKSESTTNNTQALNNETPSNNYNNSSVVNQNVTNQVNTTTINDFANKMGFNEKGYSITPTAQNGGNYRFEVRKNNDDNSVANMVGIYQYNKQTGVSTKVN